MFGSLITDKERHAELVNIVNRFFLFYFNVNSYLKYQLEHEVLRYFNTKEQMKKLQWDKLMMVKVIQKL